ncbi:salicylate hydroxylase protein [Pochonia chlamydosporia 170]|uniref:Salicylate hydroxylase protein n=1 Tax=Pochonia chlamydosporia 170 TaxID=1380566 RepID=A0A179F0L8_METCM|nr:salicylate hydroxylase protein [Pochonia chlamydosporia 170]OAQ58699.1 salicylate hydroxylase protein [Pochonia chlamydosporia 170]
MTPYHPRIAILGGGPGGLTLGRLLYKNGVPVTIYDLRDKPTWEDLSKPCGMLDLHQESGISSLRECGLYEKFLPLTGECAEEAKVYHHDGRLLHHDFGGSEEGARPEISRHALIHLLVSNIPPEMIKWNHKAISVDSLTTASGNTEMVVDFGPRGKETFDFVIGADGAWSKVRSFLTPTMPYYAGIQMMTLDLPSVSTKYPQIADFLGNGTMMALGFRNAVLAQRGAQASARIYLAVSTSDEVFGEVTGLRGRTAREAVQTLLNEDGLFADWAPAFRELISAACEAETTENSNDKLDIKPLYMLHVGQSWDTKPGATLVGDAAHLMTPFAGEGVNLAMWDCQDLALAITEATRAGSANVAGFQQCLHPLVKEFEKKMLTRAQTKAEETWANKKMMFDSDNGSDNMAEFFRSAGLGTLVVIE